MGTNSAFPKATKIYIPDFDPVTTKQGWIATVATMPTTIKEITDPWGKEYGYRTATNAEGTANANTQNPDFDLWSYGKDGKTKTETPSDKSNLDDIKNF